jgi:hypothetical protein
VRRRRSTSAIALVFIGGFLSAAHSAEVTGNLQLVRGGWYAEPIAVEAGAVVVPLLRVVANPESYHRKKIVVQGFLDVGAEANFLYLSREAYSWRLHDAAVYLDFSPEQAAASSAYRGNLVEIAGILEVQRRFDGRPGLLVVRRINHVIVKMTGPQEP